MKEYYEDDRCIIPEEIKKMSNANILVVDSKYKVEIGSDVKYISSNCTVDEDGIVTTSDKEMSYIVFKC